MFAYFLRRDFMYSRLVSNLLCSKGGPWTLEAPASTSYALKLAGSFFMWFQNLVHARQAPYEPSYIPSWMASALQFLQQLHRSPHPFLCLAYHVICEHFPFFIICRCPDYCASLWSYLKWSKQRSIFFLDLGREFCFKHTNCKSGFLGGLYQIEVFPFCFQCAENVWESIPNSLKWAFLPCQDILPSSLLI